MTDLTGQTPSDDVKSPLKSKEPTEVSLSTTQSKSLNTNDAVTGNNNNSLGLADDENNLQDEDDGTEQLKKKNINCNIISQTSTIKSHL